MRVEILSVNTHRLRDSEAKEHEIYLQLLSLSPDLEERLFSGSDQEIFYVADMVGGLQDSTC